MEKITELIANLKKVRKNEVKFVEDLNKLGDVFQLLISERTERLLIFGVCLTASMILALTGTYLGIEATEISGSVSGTDQSGSLNFRPDIFGFAFLFLIAPFIYLVIRKFKGGK